MSQTITNLVETPKKETEMATSPADRCPRHRQMDQKSRRVSYQRDLKEKQENQPSGGKTTWLSLSKMKKLRLHKVMI